MSSGLTRYLELERLMLALEREDESAADSIRDKMDPLWYELSEEDRRFLDLRSAGVFDAFEWVRLLAKSVVTPAPSGAKRCPFPDQPLRDWKVA